MSDYSEVIEERANYRVRLELDDSAEKPEDDGACPILQVNMGWSPEYLTFNEQAEGFDMKFWKIAERSGDPVAVFERYLRIFHGCRSFEVGHSDNYQYIAFDTAAWREKVGLTDEWLLTDPMKIPKVAEGSLEEVLAWANGEVFGYVVEKNVSDEDDEPEWVEIVDGSCWGHYGRKWAEQAAKEALEHAFSNGTPTEDEE